MMYFAWTFFAYSKNFIIYVDRYLGDVSTHACAQLFKCNVNSDTTFKTEQHLIYQNPITLFSLETLYFTILVSWSPLMFNVSHKRSSASKFVFGNTRVFSVCKQLCGCGQWSPCLRNIYTIPSHPPPHGDFLSFLLSSHIITVISNWWHPYRADALSSVSLSLGFVCLQKQPEVVYRVVGGG